MVRADEIRKLIERALAPVARRVRLVVSRGVVRLVDDSLKLQKVQVSLLRGELADGVERFQQYGFSSHPQPGAEAIALALGGDRSHTVVIAVEDRRFRLKALEEGEVALYDDQGSKVHLRRGGVVQVFADKVELGAEGGQPAARKGHKVRVTIPSGTFLTAAQAGVKNPSPVVVDGEITEGSERVEVAD